MSSGDIGVVAKLKHTPVAGSDGVLQLARLEVVQVEVSPVVTLRPPQDLAGVVAINVEFIDRRDQRDL